MAYVRRYDRKRSTLSAESVFLLIVLVAGAATAWWAAPRFGADLSAITTIANFLGVTERAGATRPVGYAAANAEQPAAAGFCEAGQVPTFSPGLITLKQRVGEAMGAPVECDATSVPGEQDDQHQQSRPDDQVELRGIAIQTVHGTALQKKERTSRSRWHGSHGGLIDA
jgi:hypothetical protein